jgi:hypothetical protein
MDEFRRRRDLEEQAEGRDGSVSLEGMAALLRSHHV